jgi:hypothetical protein
MKEQNYSNHTKLVPAFHGVLFTLLLLTFIGSCINLWKSIGDHQRLYSAALIVVLTFCVFMTAGFARMFALKAQDRAIRAEENFRHYLLTGKPLDGGLTMKQIIGLRFASDSEFPALAAQAVRTGMSQDAIKRAVTSWRSDNDRL